MALSRATTVSLCCLYKFAFILLSLNEYKNIEQKKKIRVMSMIIYYVRTKIHSRLSRAPQGREEFLEDS